MDEKTQVSEVKQAAEDAETQLGTQAETQVSAEGETQVGDAAQTRAAPPIQSFGVTPAPQTGLPPGFKKVKRLGQGGMGMVYLARQDDSLDREVALKMIRTNNTDDQFRRFFLSEGKRQAELHHPNILPIFSAGESDDTLYLTMHFARDGSLRDHMKAGMETRRCVEVTCDILSGLNHAHTELEAPMAHLDIKPENILFDGDNVYIADFGIAKKLAADATVMEQVAGDPRYWAPEQQANNASTKSDIYALGIMFFEMLTGERPPDHLKTINNRSDAQALQKLLPTDARVYGAVIARALNPKADERIDAVTMRDELRSLLNPKRVSTGLIAAVILLAGIAVAVSQPAVRQSLTETWRSVFPLASYPVSFEIAPVSGALWVDGKEETLRQLSLTEGEHRVVAVAPGFMGEVQFIDVVAATPTVSFALQPTPSITDAEYLRFINSFDGSDKALALTWQDPTLDHLVTLDRLEQSDGKAFEAKRDDLLALADAGDAIASTTLFFAAFEGVDVPGGAKALMPGLINASEDGYGMASLLRALYIMQSLFDAGQTFDANPHAFDEVKALLARAAEQGLPQAAGITARVAGIALSTASEASSPTSGVD